MTKLLLSIHVLAVIIAIGPIAVAASIFPAATRRAIDTGTEVPVLGMLHRICRIYAVVGILVPAFGIVTAKSLGVLTDAWLIVSIVLTLIAAVVLGLLILPRQESILESFTETSTGALQVRDTARLAMYTGIFNLLWAAVTVLMIVRPGSTTGA